ncbi:SRPBCC domain-containing protein [Flexivirga sp. ID2601S]|uniref:SRPBCC domain-containing protein n=1 Tax=Flexivirga aerilata TaxID=1656889 RepID=A0A849AIW1_9MICO|nr:SRPBCC domain-containing protein [Flexivirga aerilata]NNG40375.1 SRPBCC domain-containing protein [Flexivirga aerilata]
MTSCSLDRRIALPPGEVWELWTTPAGLATWWWPQLPDTSYEIEAGVGGRYRFESAAAGIGATGEFTRVDRPHALDFSWIWLGGAGPAAPDTVRVRFSPDGDGTRIALTHELAADTDPADLRQGWSDVLDRLAG